MAHIAPEAASTLLQSTPKRGDICHKKGWLQCRRPDTELPFYRGPQQAPLNLGTPRVAGSKAKGALELPLGVFFILG